MCLLQDSAGSGVYLQRPGIKINPLNRFIIKISRLLGRDQNAKAKPSADVRSWGIAHTQLALTHVPSAHTYPSHKYPARTYTVRTYTARTYTARTYSARTYSAHTHTQHAHTQLALNAGLQRRIVEGCGGVDCLLGARGSRDVN